MTFLNPNDPGEGKVLAQRRLSGVAPSLLYTVPTNIEATANTLQAVNVSAVSDVAMFVFIDPGGEDLFTEATQVLGGNSALIKIGSSYSFDLKSWTMAEGTQLAVKGTIANGLTVTLFGVEKEMP